MRCLRTTLRLRKKLRNVRRYSTPQWTDFSVMTYNVLSSKEVSKMTYVKPEYIAHEWRREQIQRDIFEKKPDIVMLQEADHLDYLDHYNAKFSSLGYSSLFYPMGKNKSINRADTGSHSHGSMIAVNNEKFTILEHLNFDYRDLVGGFTPQIIDRKVLSYLQGLGQVGIVALLKTKNCKMEHLTVGTTHVYWHPKHEYAKVIQTKLFLQILENYSHKFPGTPIVGGGDFNSMPDSGPYQLIFEGNVPYTHKSLEHDKTPVVTKNISHSDHFGNAYADTIGNPEFTNFTPGFKGILDYIFYSKKNLIATKASPLITEEEASREVGLPNSKYPSDHLPLYAEFSIK